MIATGNPPRRLEVTRRDGGCMACYHWPGPGPSLLLIPVLEVWGDRNRPRPSRRQRRIPERPNIQLQWMAGASHSLPLERPQEVAEAINRFVFSLDGS